MRYTSSSEEAEKLEKDAADNGKAIEDLVYCATREDVPKHLELRRRALYRQSDEWFYDHRALTRAIQWVRVVAPKSGK